MSAHASRRSAAVAFVSAITTGTALLLTACDPSAAETGGAAAAAPAAGAPATPAAPAVPAAPSTTAATTTAPPADSGTDAASEVDADTGAGATPSQPAAPPSGAAPALNLTGGTGLTVSTGTRYVVMDGGTVDFGTVVRDLAWSPDGKHAAFVDGAGNLQTADPDGGNRVLVARAPSGVTWSHPTWQVFSPTPDEAAKYLKPKNNLQFTADDHGTLRLLTIPAAGGTNPTQLVLNPFSDENAKPLPQTGNLWPNVGGRYAKSVYANRNDGQVYIRDEYLQQNGAAATRGSQPDLSNDGDLVFVRVVDGHDHLFTKTGGYDGEERDLTPNATVHYTEPAFSPDGKTIAFRGPDGTYTIPTKGGTPTKVSDTTGLPAYRG
ncbi:MULTISPECIES: PD40 domain-containing protein [Kitasatospora]|uniref:WD40 repeat protein n=1 Tax=Kitasatospora setae (strain ATCC 33774 / DSM 43861 / JCM 3304 / KCC A-0304 / NBRC 14216 / KM-6054) TaxID=452652 RepID=E4NE83_KITSK|nr:MULTISPECIES: PD40 domain-containing protein [Kitasatospora]BAJ29514.1 hypothetical protein KSE_37120 [Kitasatospora setae KM-6054]